MNDQEEKNRSDSFMKEQYAKGEEAAENEAKKKKLKKQIITIIAPILAKMIVILVLIATVFGALILFTGFYEFILDDDQEDASKAKKEAVVLELSPKDAPSDSGTSKAKVVMDTNGSYDITTDYIDEDIADIRRKIDETGKDSSYFSDFDIEILGVLMENGLDINDYSKEELKCLPLFIKAEACTQYLDLRPTSEKIKNGQYVPENLENIEESSKIPGVILVQRTNTNSNGPTILDYIEKTKFDELISNNNMDVINYFTIDDDGNLVIAKWDHNVVTVTGDYPEKLADSEKEASKDEYIIKPETIAYSEIVKKCTMPFDLLVQLLLLTEEPEFCIDLVEQVLNSKIIINIQEEETITATTENRSYTVHTKDEKYVDYEINPAENETNYLLKYAKDDKAGADNNCTNYSQEELKVTIETTYTGHSYSVGITEADFWLEHYVKTYGDPVVQNIGPNSTSMDVPMEEYKPEDEKTISDINEILNDKDAKKFKDDKESEYKSKVEEPNVSVDDKVDENDKKYKEITILPENSFTTNLKEYRFEEKKTVNQDNSETITYEMPKNFIATSIPKDEFPFAVRFGYTLKGDYTYLLAGDDRDNIIKCNISNLLIKPFYKIDLKNDITTTVTEYRSDPNPKSNTHVYAKDADGNFEKFLLVYDDHPITRDVMDDASSWLFSWMRDSDATVELVDTIKGLLHEYDGSDYGATLENIGNIFDPDEFITMGSQKDGTGWWWPIGSSSTEIIEGIEYAKGDPVDSIITSGVGPRWGSTHNGIDISGCPKGTNIIASRAGTVIEAVDGFEDGYLGCKDGGELGNHVFIQHEDGTIAKYGHMEKGTIKVKKGDIVKQGQIIGGMGTSGSSTGVHLHFEIRDGNNSILDPEEYVSPDPSLARQIATGGKLRDWIWGVEGGSIYVQGDTWIVFDPEGEDDTMNLAHGMVVAWANGEASWYPDIIPGNIVVGQKVTAEQANKIWEVKIKDFNDAIDISCAKYNVTLTSNQKDALVSYIYRTGCGSGQNDLLVSAYKNGGNSGLWNYMKEGYDHREEYMVGTKIRVAEEYELFLKGDYNFDPPGGTAKYDAFCQNPNG